MTILLAAAGAALIVASIVAPFSVLWVPGVVLLAFAARRHGDRHVRAMQRRRRARGGYLHG